MAKTKFNYLELLEASAEVMPLLSPKLGADSKMLFKQFEDIKKLYKQLCDQFECYEVYPRHNLDDYYELCGELISYLADDKVSIKIKWLIFPDVVMNEENWSVYSKINPVARFYYDGIEVTRLIKF